MRPTLHTVGRKLTALVGSSLGVVLVVLLVLAWLLHRQLLDEVDNRVDEAKSGFVSELDDDLADQALSLRLMAHDPEVLDALDRRDAKGAHAVAQVVADVYPNIDTVLADGQGRVLTELGVTAPPDRIDSISELHGVPSGADFAGIIEHGCEKPGSQGPPAFVRAKGFPGRGSIVLCEPIDLDYLDDARRKLGLELAVLEPGTGRLLVATGRFPAATIGRVTSASLLAVDGGTTWALSRFEPPRLAGPRGPYAIALALDVTTIRAIVLRNLLFALGVLSATAVVALVFGTRIARQMSRAIGRLEEGQTRLQHGDYAPVDVVPTGDELERLAAGFNVMLGRLKDAEAMKATMGKYMAGKVMAHILKAKMAMGGERLTATILFSDLRGFTSLSERMDPQTLVGLLNEYFTEMVEAVLAEDGVVDKYIGDAIMVVFGAPEPAPDDARRAVRAAVGMRQALARLNARLEARGVPPLKTGIGIHTGEVVAGTIGHEEQRQYTVIGDAVNLASRLETATKDLGVNVLVSDETYALVRDDVVARPVKEIHVKGRAQGVVTYEILGLADGTVIASDGAVGPRSEA